MGYNIACMENCNDRILAKLYTPETWFASGL